ncbi:RNA-associated protein [Methanocaldococcus villosus KIN24-T80]|uniref:RNA-associated protein n=2 Tax=Methanocaldococcus villosus TaxID=667126 RepID=N6V2X1_9EURY|nr:RNA-associated protein [Methanocaldococcus villosus KIN24-T80]
MVSLEEAVIARLTAHGEKFEILVDPYLAAKLKEGLNVDMDELLAIDVVFKDANKGEKAPEELLMKVFGTTDVKEIAKKIILKGHVQLTAKQREEIREQKKKQIITIICKNTINPQTDTPHPPHRIEKALEELKINIDIYKSAEEQVPEIIKKLKRVLPIKFEKRDIAVKIPPEFAGKAYNVLHHFGSVKQEEWANDGSLIVLIEIPSG